MNYEKIPTIEDIQLHELKNQRMSVQDWVQEIYDEYIDYSNQFSSTSNHYFLVREKKEHTQRVVKAGHDICTELGVNTMVREVVSTCTWAHDVARSIQATYFGTMSDFFYLKSEEKVIPYIYDHALEGSKLFDATFPDIYYAKEISEAIRYHSTYDIPKHAQHFWSEVTRDADKLEILRDIDRLVTLPQFGHPLILPEPISSQFLQAFENLDFDGGPINYQQYKPRSETERLLGRLAWIFDLNYAATRNLFISEAIPDTIIAYLREFTVDPDGTTLYGIEKKVDEWKNWVAA